MMLNVLALAAAAIMAPPMTIEIDAPRIPTEVVSTAIQEASAIWRTAGLEIEWIECARPVARTIDVRSTSGYVARGLAVRVTIDDNPGLMRDAAKVLGYVLFVDGEPQPGIHLSYENATALLHESQGGSAVSAMTPYERHTLLGRALGRALAHELGHFLLSSKAHTKGGLMQAHRRTTDLFKRDRDGFEVSAAERSVLASRFARLSAANR